MDEKEFECICDECSKPFTSDDEEATLCPDCWQTMIGEHEGEGANE